MSVSHETSTDWRAFKDEVRSFLDTVLFGDESCLMHVLLRLADTFFSWE